MNVLSLFDGMSCGQIALERAGIPVTNYYASEIKPHAIKVTKHNYPNTIHLGDVTKINLDELDHIDLLIGGSPCQDLSGGNKERDGLEGVKSMLFYRYIEIYKYLQNKNPKLKFLFENVIMPKEDQSIINEIFNHYPVRINSKLVSPQLRDRLYWTNIGECYPDLFGQNITNIKDPKDKNIKIADILTSGFTDREKSRALLESDSRRLTTPHRMWHRYNSIGFTTIVFDSDSLNWEDGIRYFNQTELEACQTVPDGYTNILTRDQAACLLGDGWTVDVIAHIFGGL